MTGWSGRVGRAFIGRDENRPNRGDPEQELAQVVLALDPGPVESAYAWIDAGCLPRLAPEGGDMSTVLALDPGPVESAYAWIDADTRRPIGVAKITNDTMRQELLLAGCNSRPLVAIEMVASYGMPVGREVFETCVWIGRFVECSTPAPELVYRRDVKLHHCHSAKAKDANITQALVDRFAPGAANKGKGTKAEPGWFYGFAGDVWAAYALAVYVADGLAS